MIEYEDDCVSCPPGVPCIGKTCPMKNVPHMYCDACGIEIDDEHSVQDNGNDYCVACAALLGLLD